MNRNIKMKNRIGFVHIPKCGGNSVTESLRETFGQTPASTTMDFLYFPDVLAETPVVAGHIPVWVWNTDPGRKLFTLLRDPIQRVISNYRYIKGDPGHVAHRYVIKNKLKIGDCFEHPLLRAELSNFQTKMIGWQPDSPIRTPLRTVEDYQLYSRMHALYYFCEPDSTILQRAVDRLKFDIDYALLGDSASISAMFERVTGKSDVQLPHMNKNKSGFFEFDSAELELIRQHNLADVALYKEARAMLISNSTSDAPALRRNQSFDDRIGSGLRAFKQVAKTVCRSFCRSLGRSEPRQ